MKVDIERLEKSKVKLTFTIDTKDFNERLDKSFKKNAKLFKVAGFRDGKVPRNIVEKTYGEDVLNYHVIEETADEDYAKAVTENNIEIVSKPELDIVKVNKTEGAVYTVTAFVKPEAKVKKYKGLTYKKGSTKVTKKEIDAKINETLEKNARLVTIDDRALKNKDISNINFEGFADGVAFEGGKGDNFELTIGSGQFIPGFEEQMIGMKIGETKEVNVKFPDEYHAENLKGKDAMFKVTLNSITSKELPKLDDEFVKDVSEKETLEEYKKEVEEGIIKEKEAKLKAEKETEILTALIENTEVEIPSSMIEEQTENQIRKMEEELSYQGMTLDIYCKYLNTSIDDLKKNFNVQSEKDIKLKLAFEFIAKEEKIEVTDKEIDEKIETLSKEYKKENDDSFKKNPNVRHYVKEQLSQEKLYNLVINEAIEK